MFYSQTGGALRKIQTLENELYLPTTNVSRMSVFLTDGAARIKSPIAKNVKQE